MPASSGYVAPVDADLCAAFDSCAGPCLFAAPSVHGDRAMVGIASCMGCGVCIAHYSQEAISLQRDPARREPLEIQTLIAHAAQLM